MQTSIIGYPRVGSQRELKFASEKYFRHEITADELQKTAKTLRSENLTLQKNSGLDFIPSNDFSFYDNFLDTAFTLNVIPDRYRQLGLPPLDTYFAMARGYQGENGDVKALPMKKWFNTNYHYMVAEIDDNTEIKVNDSKIFDLFTEALKNGVKTKPVITGAYTFLKLARYTGSKSAKDFVEDTAKAYTEIIAELSKLGAEWIQFDEPCLVKDLTTDDISLFEEIYSRILDGKKNIKVLLQTYFGDIRDCYKNIISMDFDGIGLDFVEGEKSLELVKSYGFPAEKLLFAGVVNGKNIWKNHYAKTVNIIRELKKSTENIVLNTSCSLLHVPYTIENETKLSGEILAHFSFAKEKLTELKELKTILESEKYEENHYYTANKELFAKGRCAENSAVKQKINNLTDEDFVRLPAFEEREKIQHKTLNLPELPTTTIGSFPQTAEVRKTRAAFRKEEISQEQYDTYMKNKIADCVKQQEEIGLDVLVHGEFERNDMVEYFGQNLQGFVFTEKAWVQSYGTRCVKPPVVWSDVSRKNPMTVKWSVYAQSLTDKPMKGMLTGPVTILNWSFPREDISLKECAYQIALAIRDEVLDLENAGIKIIQVDEAALREKLPLRKSDWKKNYLDWAIRAFRLVHSGCKPQTQIHTHMCYSEFSDIIKEIDDMDADVITFEASRSDLTILDVLKENNFRTQVGPGVYDIHSPRVPTVEEIRSAISKMLTKIPKEKLWINPDCGLKTRGEAETVPSLENMVKAART